MNIKKNIIIFGVGEYYQRYKEKLKKYNIIAFIDNDSTKQNTEIDNIKVLAPEMISALKYDYIYLMSRDWCQMKKQLECLGIEEGVIRNHILLEKEYEFWEIPLSWHSIDCAWPPDFLLISYSLGRTGAPVALLTAAKVLKCMGYKPLILSNEDGPLREEALIADIPIVIDEGIVSDVTRLEYWAEKVDYIIVNTIMYYQVLEEYRSNKPIIWWLHDSKQYYTMLTEGTDREHSLPDFVRPYAVGPIAAKNFEDVYCLKPNNLLYGMEQYDVDLTGDTEKIVVSIIGSIVHRKGQDLLFGAFEKLPEEIKRRIEVWVVGAGDINFLPELSGEDVERIMATQKIRFWGEVSTEEVKKLYADTDILVCPSREDPMPIVVTEAMMLGIPIIVSDGCGTAPIIEMNNIGLIVKRDDVQALSEAICYACQHLHDLLRDVERRKSVFQEYFSLDVFSDNIKKILSENYC